MENKIYLREDIFYKAPKKRNLLTDIEKKMSLGAVLYIPAIKKDWGKKYIAGKYNSLYTIVIDFEDSVSEEDFSKITFENLKGNLKYISDFSYKNNLEFPRIFFRARDIEHSKILNDFIEKEDIKDIVEGIVLPKANVYKIKKAIDVLSKDLKIMPIIETKEFIDVETKHNSLNDLKNLMKNEYVKERILNVRIGGTDLSGIYGLRRPSSCTIYDIRVVERCLTDIVSYIGDIEDIVLSGVVWEYFNTRESLEGLIKEIRMDKINGFIGKTAIHPSQIDTINASWIVEYDDYKDACDILYADGVSKGSKKDRMNESKPHKIWAKKTISLGNIYGVLKKEKSLDDLYQKILDKDIKCGEKIW